VVPCLRHGDKCGTFWTPPSQYKEIPSKVLAGGWGRALFGPPYWLVGGNREDPSNYIATPTQYAAWH